MTGAQPLVLVAEDEPLASMALRAQLEALDYHVLGPAHNGHEGLALGTCFPVDIAVFDYRMPGLTGLEAGQALFRESPTPVVLLTGFDIINLPERVPRPPVFASLTKPIDLSDLRSALDLATADFQRWADAEPTRHERLRALRAERSTIARAVTVMAKGGALAAAAIRFREQAAHEGRPPADVARDFLAGAL